MKYTLLSLLLIGCCLSGYTQEKYVYKILADSVKITNCDSAELIIENHTQGIPGFLFNTGNGRTVFKKAVQKINDSLFLIGADTLNIHQAPSPLKWYKESPTPAGLNNYVVTGDYAVAVAGQSNNTYGINSGVFGGAGNIAGGDNSFGIGDNSVVVGGFNNRDSCVNCVIVGGDGNILHPSAVNSAIVGTGVGEIYPFNSFIASASFSSINGPSGNNGIGETIIGGSGDTVRGDGGHVFGGISCNSYSFGELVLGLYSTAYTPGSSTAIIPTDRLFNIGNGTSRTARSDAFTILKNGNTTINGSAFVAGKTFLGGTTSPTAVLHLAPGTVTAGTAPLKFTSGSLLTTPEPGAVEFLTDKAYLGITTGTARKEFALWDATGNLTSVPFVTTNGRLTSSTKLKYTDAFAALSISDVQYDTHGTFNGVPQYDNNFGLRLWNTGAATSTQPAMSAGVNYRGQAWSTNDGKSESVEFGEWVDTKNGALAGGNWCLQSRVGYADNSNNFFYSKNFGVNNGGGIRIYDTESQDMANPTILFMDQDELFEEGRVDLRGNNIAIGASTGPVSPLNCYYNIMLGQSVGNNVTTGTGNILIGNYINPPSATASNTLDIGNVIYGTNLYNGVPYGVSAAPSTIANIGIAVTSPTARLHLAAGTSAGGTAPLKLTAGTVLSTPENGAVEYDGTNYYADASSTRYTLAKTLTTTATLDFPGTSAQSSSDLTITLNGVAAGDVVAIGPDNASVSANSCFTAWVSAANTITVRFNNYSTGAIDPASGTFRVSVMKY